jgi:hypothetical protein
MDGVLPPEVQAILNEERDLMIFIKL